MASGSDPQSTNSGIAGPVAGNSYAQAMAGAPNQAQNPFAGNQDPYLWGTSVGNGVNIFNPGEMNPNMLNPQANQVLQNNQSLYNADLGLVFGGMGQMQYNQQQAATTSLGNMYASRGMSGSSAEMGGLSQAITQNQMGWLGKEQQGIQGLMGMNNTIYGETMGIQNQFGQYQDVANQAILGNLGMQQQQEMANQAMWGQMIGAGMGMAGTIGGAALMGPAGAYAGGMLGSQMGSQMAGDPNSTAWAGSGSWSGQ